MAKGAYIGAPLTEVMTSNNIGSWFTLSDPDGISSWNGTTLTVTGTYSNERVKLTALRDMTVSFNYTTDSFCKISFKGQYICDEGDDGHYTATLEAGKYFYFSNSSAVSSQTCTFTNITCTSATSVAHKIKKGYVGVDGKARKIKKAYIGIGGVARPCWSGGELAYYGTITELSAKRFDLAATSFGNYALFGGGTMSSSSVARVEAYDKSLSRTLPTSFQNARGQLAATSIASYAMFGGGKSVSNAFYTDVDAYNTSLTKQSVTNGIMYARYDLSAASIGNNALFAGGRNSNGAFNYVCYFDSSLTYTNSSHQLTNTKFNLAATTIGNYALFGGGIWNSNYADTVDAFNTSYTKTTATALSVGRHSLAATTVGDYALFGGGLPKSGTVSTVVDVYNTSLTRTTTVSLSVGRYNLAATSVGNYAVFGGGTGGETVVDAFDTSLVRTTMPALTAKQRDQAATTIGNYALFGGGCGANANESLNTVYTYTVA